MKPKPTFTDFFATVPPNLQPFIHEFHTDLAERGCKTAFELKKNGYVASYKHGKPPKALLNFIFRPKGMLTRIYGERISHYPDFLQTLPADMLAHIQSAGDCGRLTQNTCSPKCTGYDFTINGQHFQKCRYNCFEFLITEESNPFIREFITHELTARQ